MIWRLITEQTGEVQMDNDSIWLPDICTSSLTYDISCSFAFYFHFRFFCAVFFIIRDLISVCVSSDPSKRPTFKQLINSNFFDLIFFEADEKSIMLCKELWPIVSQVSFSFYFTRINNLFLKTDY